MGFTVIAGETIEEFEGCEHGKVIQFVTGGQVTCNDYGYQYAYYTTAVIMVATARYQGRSALLCKMVVEREVYDVECAAYVRQHIAVLRRLREGAKPENRAHIDWWLGIYERIGLH